MNFPLSLSNRKPNNAWMSHGDPPIDQWLACQQWMDLYEFIAGRALVYILPGHDDLQDLPFVANLGCYLPHMIADVIVLANFTSVPRKGEEEVGKRFFKSFRYIVEQPPFCFEGEADLKWVRDNIYVGGIGQRSTRTAFQWMRKRYDMEIIEVELTDPKLYHLDTVFLPLGPRAAMVNSSAISGDDIQKLADIVEIVSVPAKHKYDGWTNGYMLGGRLLSGASSLHGAKYFDLSEFEKSGADLSCLLMHLNHK